MELKASDFTLNALCTEYKNGLSVPDFQRGFSWTKDQIEQFWTDIKGLADAKYSDHFIGPIVILKADGGRAQVVDGQQRLTTLVVLASVIRDELITEFQNPVSNYDDADEYISNKVKNILYLSRSRGDFLEANDQIKRVLHDYVILNPKNDDRKLFSEHIKQLSSKERRNSKLLAAAHSQLTKLLRQWLSEISPSEQSQVIAIEKLIEAIQEQLHFLAIEVGNEEEAFAIFETLNERGLKLSPADLLKSYLLRRILIENPNIDRDAVGQTWDQLTENLEEYDVSNFLRHYLLTKHEGAIQKNVIFKKLREEVEPTQNNRQVTAAHRVLENIRWSSLNYAILLNNRSVAEESPALDIILRKLNMIGDSHRIFLLAVASKFQNDTSALLQAARNAEIILFRWLICGKNAQVLENHFQSAALSLLENDIESLKESCQSLVALAPSDEEFEASLLQGTSKDTSLQAYALRSICRGISGVEVTTNRREVSVEHIAPKNPEGDYWFNNIAKKDVPADANADYQTYEDYLYMWGNITILEQPLNSSVRNSDWETKKSGQGRYKGYKDSQIVCTRNLLDVPQWTAEMIIERGKWFSTQALRYWKREYVMAGDYPRLDDFKIN